jgi:hypothetical protein
MFLMGRAIRLLCALAGRRTLALLVASAMTQAVKIKNKNEARRKLRDVLFLYCVCVLRPFLGNGEGVILFTQSSSNSDPGNFVTIRRPMNVTECIDDTKRNASDRKNKPRNAGTNF